MYVYFGEREMRNGRDRGLGESSECERVGAPGERNKKEITNLNENTVLYAVFSF